jgi:hypothetical protein
MASNGQPLGPQPDFPAMAAAATYMGQAVVDLAKAAQTSTQNSNKICAAITRLYLGCGDAEGHQEHG